MMTWISWGLGFVAVMAFVMLGVFVFALLRTMTNADLLHHRIAMQTRDRKELRRDIPECAKFCSGRGSVTRVDQKVP
jgi:hypothetical protein